MSLGGGIKNNEETNIVNTQISERIQGEYTVPLFQIIFLEVGEEEEYVEGQLMVEQDSVCSHCKNEIQYNTPGQQVQDKIFHD